MTQLEEAKKGHITPAMKQVADEEGISAEVLLKSVAEGIVSFL